MFVEEGFKGKHQWYHYLIGSLMIFFFFFLGQGLFAGYIQKKAEQNGYQIHLKNLDLAEMMNASGLDANWIVLLLLGTFAVGFIGIIFAMKNIHQRKMKTLITSRKKIDWNRFFLSFGLMSAFVILSTILAYYNEPENFILQFKLIPFLILLLISLALIPIQIGFEELLFRGYLMQGLGVLVKNRWFPFIMTSVLFGLMHGANPEMAKLGPSLMIYYIGTGFFLGILTLMDEGLELALGFHTANNLIQILLITSDYSVFQSPSILKDISEPSGALSEILFPLLILYPLLLLIFAKKYHWKNWSHKLFGKVNIPIIEINPLEPKEYESN